MSKLTLRVDDMVVSRAKLYAKQPGVSISEMVEAYLAAVAEPQPGSQRNCLVLRSVRGSLKKADLSDYRKHLSSKYR
jgi:hypothetical protein